MERLVVTGSNLQVTREVVGAPEPYRDVIDEMPVNPNPTAPEGWWMRTPEQIDGITVHHTLSHDPRATARYCIDVKGRPSLQYHFWVTADGEVLYCAPLRWGMWHDHCGHENTHVSVGLAGRLHVRPPRGPQFDAAVQIIRWLQDRLGIPLEGVRGHCDYVATVCPGWDHAGWREALFARLA